MTISTHVLDASRGVPAADVALALEQFDGAGWTTIGTGTTNADGRCPELVGGMPVPAGTYRIRFETGPYFAAHRTPTFYPVVELTFTVDSADGHYHVPLLLSPFAFSTYRGS